MSARTVGFDIGSKNLHAAVAQNGAITRFITEPLPEGAVKNGVISSFEAVGEFIREVCKKHSVKAKNAAVVLPPAVCLCRRCDLEKMTHEQLMINLPYEFRDYISGGRDSYIFDYAVMNPAGEAADKLELLAAAAPVSAISDYRAMFRRAGLRLKTAVPAEAAYSRLFDKNPACGSCHCVADIGLAASRLYVFSGGRFESKHVLDVGCQAVESGLESSLKIAEGFRRALHYLRYMDPGLEPKKLVLVGGGSALPQLKSAVVSALEPLGITVCGPEEILSGSEGISGICAAGAALL